MKLLLVLMIICAAAAASPAVHKLESLQQADLQNDVEAFNVLVNALVKRMFEYMRFIIKNGSIIFGMPPLDPYEINHYHLVLPAGLINLDLNLKNVHVSGIGSFVVHTGNLNLRTMTFDIDISVPVLDIRADEYDLVGDLYTAIPLYGKGKASFSVEGFRFKAKLFLKQSDDRKSVLIDRIENLSFDIPGFKSELTGVIGGGDMDEIVNAMVEEVIIDYVLRFRGAISHLVASLATPALNSILSELDTWKYIAPFVPRI